MYVLAGKPTIMRLLIFPFQKHLQMSYILESFYLGKDTK